ncbi:hypothetical protein EW146_g8964 [Bondarzewia mesenterica]|uniref:Queuosine 5'-phosphate N-glycosylase/hydrolase n=1 Tax=Bondarzewia mesenterica TaxID=1095465 RepID=A0A4S4LFI2_9AGAM|nr:hypothetical protein EW146_g8964 [Bondarzewia mesenterica]
MSTLADFSQTSPTMNEKIPMDDLDDWTRSDSVDDLVNPVLETSEWALKINPDGVKAAAQHIHARMRAESYTPHTWRTHPLHLCPPDPYDPTDSRTRATLDWLFLVSSLNFSFWSELEGRPDRYAVAWRAGWDPDAPRAIYTGYWSLVAAIDRALDEGIPITDPAFYADPVRCPDALITHVFRPAPRSAESIPLLHQRIAIMRQNGLILCAVSD